VDRDALKAKVEPVFRSHEAVVLAYLIGSAARGDMHERSDLDFAVLMRDDSIDAYTALWADLHDILVPMPFDLAILNGADPVFGFEVIREGIPLFYRSVDDLNSFELRAWHRYQDTRHLRRIGDYYLAERAKEWLSGKKSSASG
jgi:predicted nucleotidyltransferase